MTKAFVMYPNIQDEGVYMVIKDQVWFSNRSP